MVVQHNFIINNRIYVHFVFETMAFVTLLNKMLLGLMEYNNKNINVQSKVLMKCFQQIEQENDFKFDKILEKPFLLYILSFSKESVAQKLHLDLFMVFSLKVAFLLGFSCYYFISFSNVFPNHLYSTSICFFNIVG